MLPRLPSIFLGHSLDGIILLLALMKQVAMLGRSMCQDIQLFFHSEGHFRDFIAILLTLKRIPVTAKPVGFKLLTDT